MKKTLLLRELVETYRLDREFLEHCLECHWIEPGEQSEPGPGSVPEPRFDEEDLARLRLIRDLQRDFEVNDEAVPIILHLIDQLHFMRNRLRRLAG